MADSPIEIILPCRPVVKDMDFDDWHRKFFPEAVVASLDDYTDAGWGVAVMGVAIVENSHTSIGFNRPNERVSEKYTT